jgi:hypothetical protein
MIHYNQQDSERTNWHLACLILLVTAGVYLSFPSQQRHWDGAIQNAIRVTEGKVDKESRHFLYTLIGVPYYNLWTAVGYRGDATWPLQIFNATLGAAGTVVLFIILLQVSSSRGINCQFSLGFAFCYGYWRFLADSFYNVLGYFWILVTFLLLVLWRQKPNTLSPGWAGLLIAIPTILSVMASMEHLLFAGIVFLGILILPKQTAWTFHSRLLTGVAYLVCLSLGVSLSYTLFGHLIVGLRSPGEFTRWLQSYSEALPPQYMSLRLANIPIAIRSLLLAIVHANEGMQFRELLSGIVTPDRLAVQMAVVLVGIGLALAVVWTFQARKRLWRIHWQIIVFCTIWFGAYALFTFWADPFGPERWITTTIPLATGLALVFSDLRDHLTGPKSKWMTAFGVLTIGTLFLGNLTGSIALDHFQPNLDIEKALCTGERMGEDDIIISPGWDFTRYVKLVTRRQDVQLLHLAGEILRQSENRRSIATEMNTLISSTRKRGGRVFVVDVFSYDESAWRVVQLNTGLTLRDFVKYDPTPAWQCLDETVWELKSAQP